MIALVIGRRVSCGFREVEGRCVDLDGAVIG